MRVLVTGGAGYIGSVICAELAAAGHAVVVYDNFVTGHRDAIIPAARLIEGSVLDGPRLTATLADERIDAVMHLAAAALVGESVAQPGKYFRANVIGGLTLLEAMRLSDVRMLVFSSSAAVYGAPETPVIEEDAATAPTNPYGESKLAFERALGGYAEAHRLRATSLRYFNAAGATDVHGERHDPETHLIPLLLQAAAGTRDAVTLFGDDYETPDGTCVRDYVHVSDLASAHVLALEALARRRVGAAVYNLGSGSGYSVRQVIDVAERIVGRAIPVRIGPRRAGDPPRLVASHARATAELRWKPVRQDLAVIVESAWRWMRRAR
jgi:UDP-glucose 4-epimerase